MIELVEFLAARLVPEGDYTIEMLEKGDVSDIIITIDKKDIGKIIGKQGRIARSVRTLVKAAAAHSHIRYNVVIEEKQ